MSHSTYSFDIYIAAKYGTSEAIFLSFLAHCVFNSHANNKNKRDGRFWTHITTDAYNILFPFWTESEMNSVIQSCILQDLVLQSDSYDKKVHEYALTD